MEKESEAKKGHVFVIPFPAHGHINPALAFAKCLASKGLLVTFFMTINAKNTAKNSHSCSSLTIHHISDGSEHVKEPETVPAYFKRLEHVLSENLAHFIDQRLSMIGASSPKLLVYDSIMPWALEIAHTRGLMGASFFTQSLAVSSIFYHLKKGSLRFPYDEDQCVISLPSLPALEIKDVPSFPHIPDLKHAQVVVDLLAHQFLNLDKVDWIFFNSFDKLESQILDWMAKRWAIKTVGPTFLVQEKGDKFWGDKKHTVLEPKQDADYREWLDSKETGSVVYVSFGTIASLGREETEELASGLLASNCYFLWVVRSSEVEKLPEDFTSLASEKGLIIDWCHQPQVLAHHALACFMSHCGWNSTLEALSHGVPLIAMSQWVDQKTNSKFIEDVWEVGVRVKPGKNGIVGREEIAMCIKDVVYGDKGIELKANASKWKELANEAAEKDGTSAKNIDNFVSEFV